MIKLMGVSLFIFAGCVLQGSDASKTFDRAQEVEKVQAAIKATQEFRDLTIEARNDTRDAYDKYVHIQEILKCNFTLQSLQEKLSSLQRPQ